jgi:hypothetical protein
MIWNVIFWICVVMLAFVLPISSHLDRRKKEGEKHD